MKDFILWKSTSPAEIIRYRIAWMFMFFFFIARAGTCQFYVKYLGCCEVFESRGMQVSIFRKCFFNRYFCVVLVDLFFLVFCHWVPVFFVLSFSSFANSCGSGSGNNQNPFFENLLRSRTWYLLSRVVMKFCDTKFRTGTYIEKFRKRSTKFLRNVLSRIFETTYCWARKVQLLLWKKLL
jgi:hypothetical protein